MARRAFLSPIKEVAPPDVELRDLDGLVPYERNARTHSRAQIDKLKTSILTFGWTNPILADRDGIVAGHARQTAARELYDEGHALRFPNGAAIPAGQVPVIDCTGWSEEKRRAYILADNRLALDADWDPELLKVEFGELSAAEFDPALTGFSPDEIHMHLTGWSSDLDLSARDGAHTDGILAKIVVKVDRGAADRATAAIEAALKEAGIEFAL
ncbi:ParB/Srx family N-terminal domain-containing protein [Methylobacterium nodulans]|uniref:ParB domain protein nuclease n=1 Tax=Methylobacterium nodulans (strain LMG 21967 / CNCM I-2342 / ORS 2060) TaxID=460265 RepID=B8IAM6_METNO|nr:ParB/Srx family N-terminal domain-containing protein [Methylobacterium nodulans]ACL61071.1 ParB domain protein nuclease [Methylobacterium nodulans ORS 2060]